MFKSYRTNFIVNSEDPNWETDMQRMFAEQNHKYDRLEEQLDDKQSEKIVHRSVGADVIVADSSYPKYRAFGCNVIVQQQHINWALEYFNEQRIFCCYYKWRDACQDDQDATKVLLAEFFVTIPQCPSVIAGIVNEYLSSTDINY